eukprot:TRINITY_DN1291_c0_g2_i1.p1 TRINITY_DN1291_c0_g2~~TRINITY_DN1291_c0_g2_i1.p1  ORF type:complete len:334 (-),score=43.47 TRINITY_DN1291_c0_g2_i1:799-1800(-)
MPVLGSGSVHLVGRYKTYGQGKKDATNQICQKCLKKGHWTYECKGERAYISRPSRTQQLKNPKLRQRLLDPKAVPSDLKSQKEEKGNNKDKSKSKNNKDEASSISSSGGDSTSSYCSSSPDSSSSVKTSDSSPSTRSSSSSISTSSEDSSSGVTESSDSSLKFTKNDIKEVTKQFNKLKRKHAEQQAERKIENERNVVQSNIESQVEERLDQVSMEQNQNFKDRRQQRSSSPERKRARFGQEGSGKEVDEQLNQGSEEIIQQQRVAVGESVKKQISEGVQQSAIRRTSLPQDEERWQLESVVSLQEFSQRVVQDSIASRAPTLKSIAVSSHCQ